MNNGIEWADLLAANEGDGLGAVILDRNLRIRAASEEVIERSGYTRAQLLELTALDVVHPGDLSRAGEVIAEVLDIAGERSPGMYRLMFNGGEWESFELQAFNLGGDTNAIVMQFSEVSQAVRSEALVDEMVELMQLLVEPRAVEESLGRVIDFAERHVDHATLAVTTFAADGEVSTMSRNELAPQVQNENAAAHPLSLPPHVQLAVSQHSSGPWRVHNKAGVVDETMPNRVTVPLFDQTNQLLGYAEAFRPTTDAPSLHEWLVFATVAQIISAILVRGQLDNRLRLAADHDSLTGLVNRRRLLEAMNAADDLGGSGLLLIDLDQFSWINNSLGHAAGDVALVSAAESLSAAAPDGSTVARLGGDEFVIWLPDPDSLDCVYSLAENVRSTMIAPIGTDDRREAVRCSIGATVIRAGETVEEALKRADAAMYEAKRSGGDRVKQT